MVLRVGEAPPKVQRHGQETAVHAHSVHMGATKFEVDDGMRKHYAFAQAMGEANRTKGVVVASNNHNEHAAGTGLSDKLKGDLAAPQGDKGLV